MSLKAVFLVAAVAAPAAFATGYWRGEAAPETASAVRAPTVAPLVVRPGWGASEAAGYFEALNAPPPPPAPPRPTVVIAPPPPEPPDVALTFRRELSAVLTEPGAQPRVVLTNAGTLRPGDPYRDGWTLSNISATTATLTRGGEVRRIGLFSAPPQSAEEDVTLAAAELPTVSLALSNGVQEGQMSGAQQATILNSLRSAGLSGEQYERVRRMMSEGEFDRNQAQRVLQQLAQSGQMNPAGLSNLMNALTRADVMSERQAERFAEFLPRIASGEIDDDNNNRRGRGRD